VVVRLRAGNDDTLGRHRVKARRFPALRFVPHDDAVGHLVNQPFRRQVIPAADAEHRWNAPHLRRADVVGLLGAEIEERGHHHQIRPLAIEKLEHLGSHRQRPFGGSDQMRQRAASGHASEPHGGQRCLFARTAAQSRRTFVLRQQVSPVVERRPQRSAESIPEPLLRDRQHLGGERLRILPLQLVDHPLPVGLVAAIGNQMDAMPALGKEPERGMEVPQEPEVGGGKNDLHRVDTDAPAIAS
jgi:hypothetical protein